MLCDTCRWTERPGFVPRRSADPAGATAPRVMAFIPCPDCGGQAIAHCCEGLCEQPEAIGQQRPQRRLGAGRRVDRICSDLAVTRHALDGRRQIADEAGRQLGAFDGRPGADMSSCLL